MNCPWCEVALFDDGPEASGPIHARREAHNDRNPVHTIERCDAEFVKSILPTAWAPPKYIERLVAQAMHRARDIEQKRLSALMAALRAPREPRLWLASCDSREGTAIFGPWPSFADARHEIRHRGVEWFKQAGGCDTCIDDHPICFAIAPVSSSAPAAELRLADQPCAFLYRPETDEVELVSCALAHSRDEETQKITLGGRGKGECEAPFDRCGKPVPSIDPFPRARTSAVADEEARRKGADLWSYVLGRGAFTDGETRKRLPIDMERIREGNDRLWRVQVRVTGAAEDAYLALLFIEKLDDFMAREVHDQIRRGIFERIRALPELVVGKVQALLGARAAMRADAEGGALGPFRLLDSTIIGRPMDAIPGFETVELKPPAKHGPSPISEMLRTGMARLDWNPDESHGIGVVPTRSPVFFPVTPADVPRQIELRSDDKVFARAARLEVIEPASQRVRQILDPISEGIPPTPVDLEFRLDDVLFEVSLLAAQARVGALGGFAVMFDVVNGDERWGSCIVTQSSPLRRVEIGARAWAESVRCVAVKMTRGTPVKRHMPDETEQLRQLFAESPIGTETGAGVPDKSDRHCPLDVQGEDDDGI